MVSKSFNKLQGKPSTTENFPCKYTSLKEYRQYKTEGRYALNDIMGLIDRIIHRTTGKSVIFHSSYPAKPGNIIEGSNFKSVIFHSPYSAPSGTISKIYPSSFNALGVAGLIRFSFINHNLLPAEPAF